MRDFVSYKNKTCNDSGAHIVLRSKGLDRHSFHLCSFYLNEVIADILTDSHIFLFFWAENILPS